MDRGGVCLLTGGPLDCSKSSIFPYNRHDNNDNDLRVVTKISSCRVNATSRRESNS